MQHSHQHFSVELVLLGGLKALSLRKQNFVLKVQMALFGARHKNTVAFSAIASELSKSLMAIV